MPNQLFPSGAVASRRMRIALIALGGMVLMAGLWTGLLRLGWNGLAAIAPNPSVHGPLMVCGFLGTLISLERAVALNRRWTYAVPALVGLGAFAALLGIAPPGGPLLITLGSAGLVIIFGVVLSIQAAPFAVVMAAGAVAWAVGNGLWLTGWPIPYLTPWWLGFLVLTIAGERLELSRMMQHASYVRYGFMTCIVVLGLGLACSLVSLDTGARILGAGLVALGGWLIAYDIARHTVTHAGLPRFMAVCLLMGYGWLLVGGGLMLTYGWPTAGLLYDAMLHTVFVGFVFSMIFAHAPVIFPSVLDIDIPYRPLFYGPVALLHLSLVARIVGDLWPYATLRLIGGWSNAAAILLFLGATAYSIIQAPPSPPDAPPKESLDLDGGRSLAPR
ncbi:hypothetical protein [Longimonas halophila]|nr:hypothetical protein [Longimonas halophila]